MHKETAMSLYAAIDLHSSNGVLAILDEADQVVRLKRLPNDLPTVLNELAPYRDQLAGVAVESTFNWYWLVDGLMDHGYHAQLVHAAAVPQYAGLKHGNDDTDACHLATLMRLGILPLGHIYPRAQRSIRDLLRRRSQLVRIAVSLMLSMLATWSRYTGQCLSMKAFLHLTPEQIAQALPDPSARVGLKAQFDLWRSLQEQIKRIETWIGKQLGSTPTLEAVCSVPGIGKILGFTIVLETGAIERFASVGDYVSYCRMVNADRLSNGKKGEGNRRSGNRYLAWSYIEAANFAIRWSPEIRRWYDRKRSRRHRMIAIKAVAHKIARACYHLQRDGSRFDVQRAFA
jgi:transposase